MNLQQLEVTSIPSWRHKMAYENRKYLLFPIVTNRTYCACSPDYFGITRLQKSTLDWWSFIDTLLCFLEKLCRFTTINLRVRPEVDVARYSRTFLWVARTRKLRLHLRRGSVILFHSRFEALPVSHRILGNSTEITIALDNTELAILL